MPLKVNEIQPQRRAPAVLAPLQSIDVAVHLELSQMNALFVGIQCLELFDSGFDLLQNRFVELIKHSVDATLDDELGRRLGTETVQSNCMRYRDLPTVVAGAVLLQLLVDPGAVLASRPSRRARSKIAFDEYGGDQFGDRYVVDCPALGLWGGI